MTDEPDSLVLRYLRLLDGKVDRLGADMGAVKERLTALELGLAGIRRDMGGLAEADARLNERMDRIERRLERIERRLDLVNTNP